MENLILGNYKIENTKESEDKLYFSGYCCHFNFENLNMEIVDENSFKTFFKMYNAKQIIPVVNYNHDNNWIIGGIEDIISDSTGLYMEAYLTKGVKINDEMIIPNILNHTLSGLSTEGYIQNGYDGIVENPNGSYYVKDFLLTSVAITSTPADYLAHLTLNSFIDQLKSKQEEHIEEIKKVSKWYLMI